MSSHPFPDLPAQLEDGIDDSENQHASGPAGASLLFSPPPPGAPPMLHHAVSSPSLHNANTPAESVALSIHYQSSDFSEFDVDNGDDNYFNAIFGTAGGNAPSFLGEDAAAFNPFGTAATSLGPAAAHTYTTPEPVFNDIKAYPISPDQTPSLKAPSSPENTASLAAQKYVARNIAAVGGFNGSISPQQLTKVPPATAALPQLHAFAASDLATELTPDTTSSGGSLGNNDRGSLSTEEGPSAPTAPPMSSQNPHVTVSVWGRDSAVQKERYAAGDDIKTEHSDSFSPAYASHADRRGLDPSSRTSAEVPTSINEDAGKREVQSQNIVVSQWLDSAEGGHQDGNSFSEGQAPEFEGVSDREIDLGGETQNVQQLGRTYYTENGGGPITETDYEIMLKSGGVWNDSPSVLPIIQGPTRNQPETSQAAIERFEQMYHDNASIVSRVATWGTRRRSLPSIADIEEVTSGNFLKKLSIRGEARRTGILEGLRTLVRKPSTSQQLKRSRGIQDDDAVSYVEDPSGENVAEEGRRDSTKSTNTLGIPSRTQSWGKTKQPTPSISTAFVSMGSNMASIGATHTRSGSVSRPHAGSVSLSPPLTSPKSPLLKVGTSLRRPRSKSDTKGGAVDHPNLVRMLKKTGGPPVASLATANATSAFPGPTSVPATSATAASMPAPAPIKIPATKVAVADPDDDDDDDDDAFEDGDLKTTESDELIDKISPNLDGFRELVLGLNPMLADMNNYLVDRIAHQQIVRYKGLLNAKVKHLGYVKGQLCPSGTMCIGQGGSAVVLDSQGEPRNPDPLSAAYDGTDVDDVSSPLDGAINSDSFPKYIPMPPTSTLPAEFECQLCFQNKRFQKPSDWTKHVHEDVQPFTCTWDRCRDPKIFKRKADWVRHENEGHRHLEWWTCDVDECRHTCYRRDNFLQHLVREHKFNEPKHKTKAAIKRAGASDPTWQRVEKCHAETRERPQDEPCRFCGKTFPTWKKLTVHLAKHMEHISLPILRLVERKEVEADTIISPVQDPPPRNFAPTLSYSASPAEAHHGVLGGLPPNMMATAQNAGLHHPNLGQPVGYIPAAAHDPSSYMYTPVSQVSYQQAYYGQQPFAPSTGLPTHMQSLDAATMVPAVGTGFVDAQAFAGHLPVTTGGYLDPATNQYITESSGIDPSSYSALSVVDALGLQTPLAASQLPYDTSADPSVGSGGDQFTPHGSVSPFGHSPHQPQGQFYGQ